MFLITGEAGLHGEYGGILTEWQPSRALRLFANLQFADSHIVRTCILQSRTVCEPAICSFAQTCILRVFMLCYALLFSALRIVHKYVCTIVLTIRM